MSQLVVLGLIVLFVYLFIRLTGESRRLDGWAALSSLSALAAQYNGRYESRGPVGHTDRQLQSQWVDGARGPGADDRRSAGPNPPDPGRRAVQQREFRSGWSWHRRAGPLRRSPPRALGW